MTRFARAKGSKASNERREEEATPWHVMRQQLAEQLNNHQQNSTTTSYNLKEILNNGDSRKEEVWSDFGEINANHVKTPKKSKEKTKKKSKNEVRKEAENNHEKDELLAREDRIKVGINLKKELKPTDNVIDNENSTNSTNRPQKAKKKKLLGFSNNVVVKKSRKNNSTESKSAEGTKITEYSSQNMNKSSTGNVRNENRNSEQFEIETNEKKNGAVGSEKFNSIKKKIKIKSNNFNLEKPKKPKLLHNPPDMKSTAENSISTPKFKHHEPKVSMEDKSGHFKKLNETPLIRDKPLNKPMSENYNYNNNFTKNNFSHHRGYKNFQTIIANGREIKVVEFEGFLVKKDDAEELKKLRKKLMAQKIPKEQMKTIMKLERRKAEKALTREKKKVCFHCRKFGHNFSDCPDIKDSEMVKSGMCFKCGSLEHSHFECKVSQGQEFRHAVCFVCREQGHIARQCPLNSQGQYPKGGSCHLCGEVTHLRKDCPKAVEEKTSKSVTVDTLRSGLLEDIGGGTLWKKEPESSKKKIVQFK